jgi:predicted transcriptional regulator
MDLTQGSGLFGSRTRTNILMVLALLGESHPSELSRILGTSVSNVIKALDGLEMSGAVSGTTVGRTRRISLNPRYFAAKELLALLDKTSRSNAGLVDAISQLRRRPRRAGKPL